MGDVNLRLHKNLHPQGEEFHTVLDVDRLSLGDRVLPLA